MDLIDEIDRWAEVAPDRIAHISDGRVLTFGELRNRSDALAASLAAELGENRAPIAVHGHKEPEMLIAFLAAVKSGRPYVPIDLSIPQQRVARIVDTARAALTLTPSEIAARSGQTTPGWSRVRMADDSPFYVLFTSGSTGEPKGVVITLANLTAFVNWMRAEQNFAPGSEMFLNQAPFSFDLSVMDLYLSLVSGGTLFSITKEHVSNLKSLYQALAASSVTTWVSTPSFAQMCLIERTFTAQMLPRLRRFLFCGETLAPETASQLLERFPEATVWNTYGPTEATVATTSLQIDRAIVAAHSPLPVGRAMPGTRVLAVTSEGAPAPEGERGELVIAGPNVSPGYLGRDDLNQRAFFSLEDQPAYRTGDWGRVRDGLVFFEGRMDGQIKLHGYRIELGDLEANLRALPEIADAAVLPVEKGGRVDSLAAFVVLASPLSGSNFAQATKLKSQLAERIPSYMVPRKFHFLDAFPMTPNGKADRQKLAELLRQPG